MHAGSWRYASCICRLRLTSFKISPDHTSLIAWITWIDLLSRIDSIDSKTANIFEKGAHVPVAQLISRKHAFYASSDSSTNLISSSKPNTRRALAWRLETLFKRSDKGAERALEVGKISAFIELIS